MITHRCAERIDYDGSQLRAHWILRRFAIAGDALVAFRGACDVLDAEMADLADLGGPGIRGSEMLHFLMERFDDDGMRCAVLRQRLLSALATELLVERGHRTIRRGDDLWFDGRKLSISIATRSAVSTLFHFALNVSNRGTPVPTAALDELGVDPVEFADELLARAAAEEESMRIARAKVRAKEEA